MAKQGVPLTVVRHAVADDDDGACYDGIVFENNLIKYSLKITTSLFFLINIILSFLFFFNYYCEKLLMSEFQRTTRRNVRN